MVGGDDDLDAAFGIAEERLQRQTAIAAEKAALVRQERSEDALDRKRIGAQHRHDDADVRLTRIGRRRLAHVEESGPLLDAGD